VPLALTGYETLLLAVALVFISFALVVALVIPRARPDFPAKRLGWFIAAALVLFVAQLSAVLVLAEVGEADEPAAAETTPGEPGPSEPGPTETEPTETEPTETGPTETEPTETGPTETGPTETTPPTQSAGDPAAGKAVFTSAGCATCHTLADAGTSGTVGPNLDAAKPPYDLVVERVTNGMGVMPSFTGQLSEQQIQDVAAYVSSVAGS
jgi:cytochrome c6